MKLCSSVKAGKDWAIIQYEKEDKFVESKSGIIVPSARGQRLMMKDRDHTIGNDPDVEIPDIIRAGILVSGECGVEKGATVFFNKHDAVGFTVDNFYLYAIQSKLVVASLSTPHA